MTIANIRKRLSEYMLIADDKKVKAIYSMVEDEINTADNDWDEDFLHELKRRSNEVTMGKTKTYNWSEVKKAARGSIKRNDEQ